MSKTSTGTTTTFRATISRSTSSILLSPSKRRKVDGAQPHSNAPPNSVNEVEGHATEPHGATLSEIHRWTFTKAAIAPCFIRDVLEMRESGSRDMEFFWLGRIPCRTVRVVGLVVGIQVWERRTIYTIDDGTAVIDCAYVHPQAAPASPAKPKVKEKSTVPSVTRGAGQSFADYLPRTRIPTFTSSAAIKRTAVEPPPPPQPCARVGQSVRLVGRVVVRHETRLLLVDEMARASFDEESVHWLNVSDLHHSTYYPKDAAPPFVPPALPSVSTYASQFYPTGYPGSPSKRGHDRHTPEPGTPGSVRSSVASTNTSPSTAGSPSSLAPGGEEKPPSPVRLRHPARLHTRDLTVHTLRIYIKHYMDNAPPPTHCRRASITGRSLSPTPTPRSTRGSRHDVLKPDETPRASRMLSLKVYGYTLSHLRRVSELSLLSKRIVNAEARRRPDDETAGCGAVSMRVTPTRNRHWCAWACQDMG
ncbi:hypothetical protein BC628DRAFT_80078 [Trametes gibbosa]|nr:hypothetical protein BC628DRAFT_80078 [Trametes gibbosa]